MVFRFLKRGEDSEGDDAPTRALLRILDLNKEMAHATRPETLPDRILDAAIELVGAERGFLIERSGGAPADATESSGDGRDGESSAGAEESGEGTPWDVVAARNFDRENVRKALRKVSRSITTQVLASGEVFRSDDAINDESLVPSASMAELKLRSVLCVPLSVAGEVKGCLYVDNRFAHGQFDASAQEILEAFADQASLALERVRLLADYERVRARLEEANRELKEALRDQAQALDSLKEGLSVQPVELEHEYPELIGRGRAMTSVLTVLDRITDGDFPVLLLGESGTGKELVGRALHDNGPRKNGPFVAVNCGAIAEGLLESELFGAVKGAYTGSVKDRPGLIEAAGGGVLFLDEIGEMSLPLQAKLLRVLQDRRVRRVGGNEEIPVDVRVVSATNRDLAAEVAEGRFREDLYYRLKVVQIEIPPLRERREDIPQLVDHFLAKHAEKAGIEPPRMARPCLEHLMSYDWPGNVRELENEITRMIALGGEELGPELVQNLVRGARPAVPSSGVAGLVGRRLVDVEADLIRATLEATGGKRGDAARMLGIPRRTFYNRLKALGIDKK